MFELGNNLREARQRRRIDLVIAEQDTKIRSKYLAALETEDFDILPGPVFVRGFLRTYSRYLGLDPQMFVDEYNARFGRFEEVEEQASPALGRPGLAQERMNRGRRAMRILVVGSLVALAALSWLGLRQPEVAPVEGDQAPLEQPVAPAPSTELAPGALDSAADVASTTPPVGVDPPSPNARKQGSAPARTPRSEAATGR